MGEAHRFWQRSAGKFRRGLTGDLSVDYRVVDGGDGPRFLVTLADHVEDFWFAIVHGDS